MKDAAIKEFSLSCPVPVADYPQVLLAHGSGGRLMHRLINDMFASTFYDKTLEECHDAAVLEFPGKRLALTTDSYVVHPLFFPGGNIGTLAVNGTVNDLAMAGARPLALSLGFILEEGLSMETLWEITRSIRRAADAAGVNIVTGDTKVVDRGKGDGMFINTAGIGVVESAGPVAPSRIREGDVILLNGDVARHGMSIMAVREGLEFDSAIESDTAPLWEIVSALLEAGIDIHCLRDLTRGGLASTLNELAAASSLTLETEESLIPVREDVAAACEVLGLDPLYVANEGRFVAFVTEKESDKALKIMRRQTHGAGACRIGKVAAAGPVPVTLKSRIGARRILDMLSGDQLPRIC